MGIFSRYFSITQKYSSAACVSLESFVVDVEMRGDSPRSGPFEMLTYALLYSHSVVGSRDVVRPLEELIHSNAKLYVSNGIK